MKFVTFDDMKPGMVLYPVDNVNDVQIEHFGSIMVLKEKMEPDTTKVFGKKRSMSYISLEDPYMGFCWSAWRTGDEFLWMVVEDVDTLNRVRERITKSIAETRESMDEMEKWVSEHV